MLLDARRCSLQTGSHFQGTSFVNLFAVPLLLVAAEQLTRTCRVQNFPSAPQRSTNPSVHTARAAEGVVTQADRCIPTTVQYFCQLHSSGSTYAKYNLATEERKKNTFKSQNLECNCSNVEFSLNMFM